MNRFIKYKQVCKLAILGNDDINNTTSSQYIVYPSKINGITINNAGTNYTDANTQINIVGGGGVIVLLQLLLQIPVLFLLKLLIILVLIMLVFLQLLLLRVL